MPETHAGPIHVASHGKKTSAFWSAAPNGTAVVFVHGFGGSSLETWDEFQTWLPMRPKAIGADIVFFGYDGLYATAQTSASSLREMLRDWISNPLAFVNSTLDPEDHRSSSPPYEKVIVVAHSLGAVISRAAMVDAHRANRANPTSDPWVRSASLLLFAPAHMGASVDKLVSECLGMFTFLRVRFGIIKHFSVLSDLEQGSQFLKMLNEFVSRAVEQDDARYLCAREVVTSSPRDHIVVDVPFHFEDQPAAPMTGSHTSICKPTRDFQDPVDVVARHL